MGHESTQCPSFILSHHTYLFFFFNLYSCLCLPIPFSSQLTFEENLMGMRAALCLLHHFHNRWSWLTFRILGSISNSDILNHHSRQEPIETASIKSLHQCCHPQEPQAVRAGGTPFSRLLVCPPSLSFLWQSVGHGVAKPSSLYGFSQIVYHSFSSLWYHGFSHLLSLKGSFKKIHINNPYF